MKKKEQLFIKYLELALCLIIITSCNKEIPEPAREEAPQNNTGFGEKAEVETEHYIGELYGGGIVFYVDESKKHGLIVSLQYLSKAATFSNILNAEVGAQARNMTNGKNNTEAIVQQQGHLNSAARLCMDYKGGGYQDWYLPSLNELLKCQEQRLVVYPILLNTPGADPLSSGFEWSSSEVNAEATWGLSCSTMMGPLRILKYAEIKVRAVRAF